MNVFGHFITGLGNNDRKAYYASRALVLARKDDFVFVPNDGASIQSLNVLPFLAEVGLGPDAKNVFVMEEFSTEEIKNRIDANGGSATMYPFSGIAPEPWEIAEKIGARYYGAPTRLLQQLDDNCYFHQDNINLPFVFIPPAVVFRNEFALQEFLARQNDAWLVKSARTAFDCGTVFVYPDGRGREKVHKLFKKDERIVLQKHIPNAAAVVYVNLLIGKHVGVKVSFVVDQMFDGERTQPGYTYPSQLTHARRSLLIAAAEQLGAHFASKGIFGSAGIKFLVEDFSAASVIWAIEANLRIISPRYPFAIMHRLKRKAFASADVCFRKALPPEMIRQKLDDIFFRRDRPAGVIFFNYNPCEGKMVVTALGNHREQTVELLEEAQRRF